MMKIKTAHWSSRADFTDVNVRRLLGNINEKGLQMQQKLQQIEEANNQMDDLKMSNPHIALQEIQTTAPELWQMLEDIMEGDWSLNPHQ